MVVSKSHEAPFSYTCRNSQVSECVGFEESVPFSYTCRKSQVSQCVEFQESAPFSYTCHDSQVSECVEVTRTIACPTFVYGLACDYVVFAEVFSHHVQNLFPNVLVEVCPGGLLDAPEVKKYSILVMDVDHILRLKTHICIHLAMETHHSLFS